MTGQVVGGARGYLDAAPAKLSSRRPVRVVLEGEAVEVTREGLPMLLRVYPTGSGITALVDPAAASVTVEDIAPPRVWMDGDVVQHSEDTWTLTRERGQWLSTRIPNKAGYWTDEKVTAGVVDNGNGWGSLRVLRYQHGGDA